MTYEEYKKQRLAQNNTQSNVSNATKINTAPVNRYEEYKKQRLAQNSFNASENIQKFNNILENGQKMKINMTPTQAIIEKGKQLYQEPNMLKNIKPEMSYAGDVIDKKNILKKDSEYLQQIKKQKLEKMNQRTNELIAMTYKNKLANGVNLADDKNVITSLMGRKLGQKPSDKGNLLKVPENMKDNNRRFEDGYQFGDISKTALENLGDSVVAIGSTALEVPARLVKGILSVPEGIANAGASIVAGISDMVGQDDYANELRRRVAMGTPFVKTHAFMDNAIDKLNSNSFSGNLLDSATEGIGQSTAQMAVGSAIGKFGEVPIKFGEHTLNMPTTAFVTGMGNSASETYAKAEEQLGGIENATGKEKLQMALRILRGGTVEGVSEGLFGLLGVGGTDITEEFAKKAVAKAETAFEKQLTKIIIAGGGEAAEEFISYASNYLLDNYANKFGQLDFSENWNWDDVMQEMASAFISSGISQGVTSAVQINKATQNAIQLAEREQGRQLTTQEISEIRNSVANEVLGAREELENAQNSTNINENTPNIEQISQNNVQNVSNNDKLPQNVSDNALELPENEKNLESNIKNTSKPQIGEIYETIYQGSKVSMRVTNIEKDGSVSGRVTMENGLERFVNMPRDVFSKRFSDAQDITGNTQKSTTGQDMKTLPTNNVIGNIEKKDLLLLSKDLQHKGEVFVDERFAKGLKSDSNIIKIEDIQLKTSAISQLRKIAKDFTTRYRNSVIKNSDTGLNANITQKGIKETISKDISTDKAKSLKYLPQLIEEAVYKNSSIDIDEKNDIYHYLVALSQSESNEKLLNYITLKETPTGTKFHYNTTQKIDEGTTSSPRSGKNAKHMVMTQAVPSTNNIIQSSENYVNNKNFGFPTNEQLQAMDNKKISESADVLNMKEKKIKSLEEIANMTENDAKTENGVNYKHKKDKNTPYQRKFFENVETSKIINQEVKDTIEMTTYERQANEQTLEKAKNSLDEQGDKLIKQWERKTKNFTAEDVAIGAILIERYQQQGDNESAVNVVQKLADMGTEAGRAVQMFSIFQRLTPEAMLIYQQRKLNDVFKEVSQRKTGEWVEANKDKFQLTSEDGKFITEQVEKAQQATSERQKQIELAEIEARINNKLPPDRGQTIKAIRRISMLFNPKTQVRNIVGNTLIMPVNDVADIIGTQIDKAIAKRTGIRTTNNPIFKEKGKGFKKGIAESIQDYKMGIRTEPSGSKYEFNFGGKSFNENTSSKALNVINNKLNGIENLLGAVMSGGDRPFYEAAFNNSLQGQMKANNVMTPTTEMIDIAVNEALSRTWNDSNSYTEAVLGIRRQMNKLNIGGFGLGDLIIPFAKTPANLTKAMVEYSPLGTIEAIINYSDMKKAISRGEMTAQQQKNFVNSTSKAIAGSILYLIAGALVQSGAVTGSADDDKDIKNFEQNVLGIQPYSIKIGDKTFTYSWANPLNAPLAIMADTYKMSKEKAGLFDILTNGFKVAGEVVVDNSFLQGIKELFEADSISEGVVNAIVDMPAQFIPTFLSQFATLGDKSKRQTFEYGDKLKSTINQIKAKIPGAKNTLAPTVNTFGEEVENYGGDNSTFNVFLNPANISKANATDTQKELYALYEATKDKTIFPMQAPYYLSDDGEKVNLSSNERSEYQKRSGEYVSKELHALFDSEFYKTLENEDKVEVVNKIVKDANTHAKSKWITTKATKELKKIQEELKDVPMVDYYNAWLAQKDAEGKKNAKGETISGTKKKAKIKAINSAVDDDLTTYQKKTLYRIFNVN